MKKQEILYTLNGVIGTKKSLLVFAPEDAILKRATTEEIQAWEKVNK